MKKFGSKIATVNEYQVPTHYLIVQSRPLIVIVGIWRATEGSMTIPDTYNVKFNIYHVGPSPSLLWL